MITLLAISNISVLILILFWLYSNWDLHKRNNELLEDNKNTSNERHAEYQEWRKKILHYIENNETK